MRTSKRWLLVFGVIGLLLAIMYSRWQPLSPEEQKLVGRWALIANTNTPPACILEFHSNRKEYQRDVLTNQLTFSGYWHWRIEDGYLSTLEVDKLTAFNFTSDRTRDRLKWQLEWNGDDELELVSSNGFRYPLRRLSD